MSLTVISVWTPQEKFDVVLFSGRTSLSTCKEVGAYYYGALVLVFVTLFEGV
jgi:hypothetical protein